MKLRLKILLHSLLLSSLASLVYIYVEYREDHEHLRIYEDQLQQVLMSVSLPGLADALWLLSQESALKSLEPLFYLNHVTRVFAFDEHGQQVFHLERGENHRPRIVPQQEEQPITFTILTGLPNGSTPVAPKDETGRLLLIRSPLAGDSARVISPIWASARKDSQIFMGHLVLEYSRSFFSRRLSQSYQRFILWVILFVAIKSFFDLSYLNSSISKPVQRIIADLKRWQKGDHPDFEARNKGDEISSLTEELHKTNKIQEQNVARMLFSQSEGKKVATLRNHGALKLLLQVERGIASIVGKKTKIHFYIHSSFLDGIYLDNGFARVAVVREGTSWELLESIPPAPAECRTLTILSRINGKCIGAAHLERTEQVEENWPQLEQFAAFISLAFENSKELRDSKAAVVVESEQEIVELVQKSLIPLASDTRAGNFLISSYYRSAKQSGGDWWGYFPLDDNRIFLLIGDVAGHGTDTAFTAAVVKGFAASLPKWQDPSPGLVLAELSQLLLDYGEGEKFMTLFAAILDAKTQTIRFANAGHHFPFVLSKGLHGNQTRRLVLPGPRLGKKKQSDRPNTFTEKESALNPGDFLVFFTDGLVERVNREGEQWNDFRLRQAIQDVSEFSPRQIVEKLVLSSDRFSTENQDDDTTLVVVEFQANSQGDIKTG